MILIGSMAARLGGFLPAWRTEQGFAGSGDVDLILRPAELEALERSMRSSAIAKRCDRYLLFNGHHTFDIWASDAAIDQLADMCPPAELVRHVGLVQLAPPEVIWATLYYTAGSIPCWREKSLRDLAAYDRLVRHRALLTDAHWHLAQFFRADLLAYVFADLGISN